MKFVVLEPLSHFHGIFLGAANQAQIIKSSEYFKMMQFGHGEIDKSVANLVYPVKVKTMLFSSTPVRITVRRKYLKGIQLKAFSTLP